MAADVLKKAQGNSASTTLSSSVSDSDTSFPLTSDTNFAGEGMIIIDEGLATEEYAYATGKVGSSLTVPLANRGLESTSAVGHSAGATVRGTMTAKQWNDTSDALENVLLATTGAVDTTKVVTPGGTQTLTNKTLTSPVLNTPTYSANAVMNITAKASVYQSTQQLNLTDNTATQVTLDGETYDPGSNFATNAFTAPVTGYYLIVSSVTFVSVIADKPYKTSIYVNDAEVARATQHAALADTVAVPCSGIFLIDAGHTVKLYATQVSGAGTVDLQNGALYTFMMVQLLA